MSSLGQQIDVLLAEYRITIDRLAGEQQVISELQVLRREQCNKYFLVFWCHNTRV